MLPTEHTHRDKQRGGREGEGERKHTETDTQTSSDDPEGEIFLLQCKYFIGMWPSLQKAIWGFLEVWRNHNFTRPSWIVLKNESTRTFHFTVPWPCGLPAWCFVESKTSLQKGSSSKLLCHMHSGSVSYHCKQCSVWPALLPASACAWNIIHQDMSLYSFMPLWLTCLAWESHQHAWHWHAQPVTPSQFLAITGRAQLRSKPEHFLLPKFRFFEPQQKKQKYYFRFFFAWQKLFLKFFSFSSFLQ